MRNSISIGAFLIIYYGLYGHIADVHIPTPEEEAFMDNVEKDKENAEAWDTFNDPNSTPEEGLDAFEQLVENKEII